MAKTLFYISSGIAIFFIILLIIRITYIKRKINKNLLTRKEYKQKFKRMFTIYIILSILFFIVAGYFLGHDAFTDKKTLKENEEYCLNKNKSYYKCTWSKINNTCNCVGTKYQGVSDTMRG